jgi:hypothetical protein
MGGFTSSSSCRAFTGSGATDGTTFTIDSFWKKVKNTFNILINEDVFPIGRVTNRSMHSVGLPILAGKGDSI